MREQYDLSRAVFREAMRIVEHRHVGVVRRGRGGGLLVAAPSIAPASRALVLSLHTVRPSFDDAVAARYLIEDAVVETITARTSGRSRERTVARLRARHEAIRDPTLRDRELHVMLSEATENPVLALLVGVVDDVVIRFLPRGAATTPAHRTEVQRAHANLIDAISAGDPALARRRMRRHLETETVWLRSGRARRRWPFPLSAVAEGSKRGKVVANEILTEIIRRGWEPGSFLGSEAALMARFDASRSVFREAIRVLEYDDVVDMRRGRGGGLFVLPRNLNALTDAIAIYFERRRVRPAQIASVQAVLGRHDNPVLDVCATVIASLARNRRAS